jgi:hypothetical protein
MPQPGYFILHSRVVPPLDAGDYTLQGTQEISGGATEPYTGNLRINSARFRMPPEQILSIFPPANSEGSYESRLPQVVLRRRTLPWERKMDPSHPEIPWLALVLIAEGEGQLSGESDVKDCITPGVKLTGPGDVATGLYLTVSQTVVKKVFPTKDDLELLVHVREVDLNDTELAMGDDDGFLAVVLANRLPQFDRVNCQPVHYMACLINLEGQLNILPTPADDAVNIFNSVEFVQDVRQVAETLNLTTDQYVMGQGVSVQAPSTASAPAAASIPPAAHVSAAHRGVLSSSWAAKQETVSSVAVSAAPSEAGRLVRDAMTTGFRFPVDTILAEPTYRFPVLAHWSFTCTGAGSFATLMQGLDVGLLGTVPGDIAALEKPPCAPPPKGDAPPPTKPPRPDAEVTETGHVGLPHLTRRGDSLRAWYRGPFTLHITERDQPDSKGHLAMAHTSDQLRRVVPDGREDLALAAAFEIGRLLALSQPSVVAALIRWRDEQFGAERARQIAAAALGKLTLIGPALSGSTVDLGRLVGQQIILATSKAPGKVLAPNRPLVDPGRPLKYLSGSLEQIIADGFGFSLAAVTKAQSSLGLVGALNNIAVPSAPAAFNDATKAYLLAGLASAVDQLTASTLATATRPGLTANVEARAGSQEEGDALDQLLAAAANKESR